MGIRRAEWDAQAAMSLRCLIVDDNASFLAAARGLLEGQGMTVTGVATTAAAGRRLTEDLQPDVILVDIDLGDESGLGLVRELTDRPGPGPSPNVILISAYPEEDFAELVAESPAIGFVAKSDLSVRAIERLIGPRGTEPDAAG